jgi:copper chaperone NosL
MKKYLFVLSICSLLLACSTSPQPIDYGHVGCEFCKMTIVDQRYAAQLVTTKGKTFVFDAAECMINYTRAEENQRHKYSQILVTNYLVPTNLIDANTATYLRSEQLPSPMGEYITAVESVETAKSLQEKHGGTIYDWNVLNSSFENLTTINHSHY